MRINQTTLTALGLIAILAAFATLDVAHAQTESSPQQQSKPDSSPTSKGSNGIVTLPASSHLVILDVSVFDWKGSPATGLAKDAFHLVEDGHGQVSGPSKSTCPLIRPSHAKNSPPSPPNFRPTPSPTSNPSPAQPST